MPGERTNDETILHSLPEDALAVLSAEQRTALDHVLARLAAAERVCEMVAVNLSPKQRKASEKKLYWWDVAIAIKQWEEIAESG